MALLLVKLCRVTIGHNPVIGQLVPHIIVPVRTHKLRWKGLHIIISCDVSSHPQVDYVSYMSKDLFSNKKGCIFILFFYYSVTAYIALNLTLQMFACPWLQNKLKTNSNLNVCSIQSTWLSFQRFVTMSVEVHISHNCIVFPHSYVSGLT